MWREWFLRWQLRVWYYRLLFIFLSLNLLRLCFRFEGFNELRRRLIQWHDLDFLVRHWLSPLIEILLAMIWWPVLFSIGMMITIELPLRHQVIVIVWIVFGVLNLVWHFTLDLLSQLFPLSFNSLLRWRLFELYCFGIWDMKLSDLLHQGIDEGKFILSPVDQ